MQKTAVSQPVSVAIVGSHLKNSYGGKKIIFLADAAIRGSRTGSFYGRIKGML